VERLWLLPRSRHHHVDAEGVDLVAQLHKQGRWE
jgi:hypothetical protein